MAFPTSPANGDTHTTGGRNYVYVAAQNLWQFVPLAAATGTEDGLLSAADKAKLDALESGATGDQTGAEIIAAINGEAGSVVMTEAQSTKLDAIEDPLHLGTFASEAALNAAHPTGVPGNSADVDAGAGTDVQRYIWDDDDSAWVAQAGVSPGETGASIVTKIDAVTDENLVNDAELANIQRDSVTLKTNGPAFPAAPEVGDEHFWDTDSQWYKFTDDGTNTFWLNI